MHIRNLLFIALLIAATTGCKLDQVPGSSSDVITEEDLMAATQILGASVSSNYGGVVLSLSDALALISQSGYDSSGVSGKIMLEPDGFQAVSNLRMGYNQETGFYTVTFQRFGADDSQFETDTLLYVFRDMDGEEIIYPRERSQRIESIRFSSDRQGRIFSQMEETNYQRNDEFLVTEVRSDSTENTLPVEGSHKNSSSVMELNAQGERIPTQYYETEFEFLNIILLRTLNDRGQIASFSVTGGMSFSMKAWETEEKLGSPLSVNGTLTFNGDGTAIMRISGVSQRFELDIETGEILNQSS